MKIPQGTKLITKQQTQQLMRTEQLLIWYSDGNKWLNCYSNSCNPDDIDSVAYAINTQDYYHYFGYDVVLPKPTKDKKGNNIVAFGWSVWLQECRPDFWQVVHSGGKGVVGSLEDCQEYIIDWFSSKVAELPFKVNFKFKD